MGVRTRSSEKEKFRRSIEMEERDYAIRDYLRNAVLNARGHVRSAKQSNIQRY